MPGQHVQAPNHQLADYSMGTHTLAPDADYRQAPNMYPVQAQPGAAAYGQAQPQMYSEMDPSMYGSYMPPQQVSSSDFDKLEEVGGVGQ